jgi:hypothetical protein
MDHNNQSYQQMHASDWMVAECWDVFCGDGRLEGEVVIEVDDARELEQLEKRKIIEKVHESSDWTSLSLFVEKAR